MSLFQTVFGFDLQSFFDGFFVEFKFIEADCIIIHGQSQRLNMAFLYRALTAIKCWAKLLFRY